MVLNFSNFEIMNNKELVSILVRQLCDMDDHGNGLAEDSLYDFVNNLRNRMQWL